MYYDGKSEKKKEHKVLYGAYLISVRVTRVGSTVIAYFQATFCTFFIVLIGFHSFHTYSTPSSIPRSPVERWEKIVKYILYVHM